VTIILLDSANNVRSFHLYEKLDSNLPSFTQNSASPVTVYAILKVYIMAMLNYISIENCAVAMYRRTDRGYRQEIFAPDKNFMPDPIADNTMGM
jgi:hypothetical protein